MPLTIGEVTSDITVEPKEDPAGGAQERPLPDVAAAWRFRELFRKTELDAARTRGVHDDD